MLSETLLAPLGGQACAKLCVRMHFSGFVGVLGSIWAHKFDVFWMLEADKPAYTRKICARSLACFLESILLPVEVPGLPNRFMWNPKVFQDRGRASSTKEVIIAFAR